MVAKLKFAMREKVLLKGFLIWTKIPSTDRLLYKFDIPWGTVDIKKLHSELTKVSPKIKITSSRSLRKHRIQVQMFIKAPRRLERVRDFHFENLHENCIVIQKIGVQEFWRNIYLLPADNLKQFLERFDETKRRIEEINKIIREECRDKRYTDVIMALDRLGLYREAEELDKLRDKTLTGDGGWLLPPPVIRLERLALRVEDVTELIDDPKLKRKVTELLEEQYSSQLQELFDNIKEQVKQIVAEAVRERKLKALEKARGELRKLSNKLEKIGLHALAEAVNTVSSKLSFKTSIKHVESVFESARHYI